MPTQSSLAEHFVAIARTQMKIPTREEDCTEAVATAEAAAAAATINGLYYKTVQRLENQTCVAVMVGKPTEATDYTRTAGCSEGSAG